MQKVIKSQHHCQEGWYLSTIYRVETRQEWDRRQMSIKGGVCIGWLYKFDPPTPKQCIKPGKVSKARVLCSWYPSFCIGLPRHTSNTATESIWNWIRSTAGEGVKNGTHWVPWKSICEIGMWNLPFTTPACQVLLSAPAHEEDSTSYIGTDRSWTYQSANLTLFCLSSSIIPRLVSQLIT